MNKLYSQSMCSVKQWRSYQMAEALVSAEVDEVRAEADEIESGWSQVCTKKVLHCSCITGVNDSAGVLQIQRLSLFLSKKLWHAMFR